MPSPITAEDFQIPNPSADVCDQIVSLISISEKLHRFFEWMLKNNGELSDEFKSALASAILPVGCVVFRPVASVPSGFVEANGQSLDRTTYAALFSVYGTQFGSDGATTFKTPDLQSTYLAGRDGTNGAGDEYGANEVTLDVSQLARHGHTPDPVQLEDSGSGDIPGRTIFGGTGLSGPSGGDLVIGETGGDQPHENRPKTMSGLWLIRT